MLALTHLEAQRHAMCMFTSCGWFFEDLARIETVQVLRYAARCTDLLAEAGVEVPLDAFFDQLSAARSNDPDEGTALQVWERHVMASRVDERRVVAHVALIRLLRGGTPSGPVGGFNLTVERHARAEERGVRLDTGRLTLKHRRTGRRLDYSYAVVGTDDFQVLGALRPAEPFERDDAGAVELHRALEAGSTATELQAMVLERFGPDTFGLDSFIPEAAPRVLGDIAQNAVVGLVHRACATGGVGEIQAVRRFLALVRSAGLEVDLAPAQEALYQALLPEVGETALSALGAELGLAVGKLGLPH